VKRSTYRLFQLGFSLALMAGIAVETSAAGIVKKQRVVVAEQGVSKVSRSAARSASGAASYQRTARRADGQGNAYSRDLSSYKTASGGQGYKLQQSGTSSDGSVWRTTNKDYQAASGANYQAEKALSRDDQGQVSYQKSASGERADGTQYQSEVELQNGQLVRSTSCSDSAGNTVDCR